jgi:hypothetical protein
MVKYYRQNGIYNPTELDYQSQLLIGLTLDYEHDVCERWRMVLFYKASAVIPVS